MEGLEVQFLGCGDAMGSGGRLQTCISVRSASRRILLDCGATAVVSLHRCGVDPDGIDLILLSHLHGDHFGGLPFFLLNAQYVCQRTSPLVIAGPRGVEERVQQAREVLYPGSGGRHPGFDLEFVELMENEEQDFDGVRVRPIPVIHASGAPSHALRLEWAGRTLAYSGDTEWTDTLLEAASGTDLFICEASFYERRIPNHLSYTTLIEKRPLLGCRRMILTHLSQEMIERAPDLAIDCAEDGLTVRV